MIDDESPAREEQKASRGAAPATAELKTPDQWAEVFGEIARPDPRLPQSAPFYKLRHAAANQLYGWSRHAYHHADEPFLLTERDYLAALESAANHPPQEPHTPAYAPGYPLRSNQENS